MLNSRQACLCIPVTQHYKGQKQDKFWGLLATIPAGSRFSERLYIENKVESDRAGHLASSSDLCMVAYMYINARMHTHTHTTFIK